MFLLNSVTKKLGGKRNWLPITTLCAGFFILIVTLVPLPVMAGVGNFVANYIILPIAGLIGRLVLVFIDMLIAIVQYNDFINAPTVIRGWVIIRDVCNMFFIVILLMLAFGTIFKIEEYQYNKYLGKLLIMAVLVNFSKGITGFFIDFAQVIMLTFVNGFKEAAAGNFINGFHVEKMFDFSADPKSAAEAGVEASQNEGVFFQAALLALISILITLVVIGVYLVIFLLRIVALWFLIIVSPLAYLLAAAPGQAGHYANEWWQYFTKYAITGPILAFFLWLSLAVMQNQDTSLGSSVGDVAESTSAAITAFGSSDVLLSFIINIILLLGGLWMAQRLGVAGSGMAGSALSKIKSAGTAPFRGMAKGAAWAASKGWKNIKQEAGYQLNKRLPPALNIAARVRARRAQKDELYHGAQAVAVGKARERREKDSTGIPYESMARRSIEAEQSKKFSTLTKEQRGAVAKRMDERLQKNPHDFEAHEIYNSLLTNAAGQQHFDDVLTTPYMRDEAEWTDKSGNKFKGFAAKMRPVRKKRNEETGELEDTAYNDENGIIVGYEEAKIKGKDGKEVTDRGKLSEDEIKNGYTQKVYDHGIAHDFLQSRMHGADGASLAYNIGEISKKAGRFELADHGGGDAEGNMRIPNINEAQANAATEFNKLSRQDQLALPVHNFNALYFDPKKNAGMWGAPTEGSFEAENRKNVFDKPFTDRESGPLKSRTVSVYFGNSSSKDNKFIINSNTLATLSLRDDLADKSKHKEAFKNINKMYEKTHKNGFSYVDDNNNILKEFNTLEEFLDSEIRDATGKVVKESFGNFSKIAEEIKAGAKAEVEKIANAVAEKVNSKIITDFNTHASADDIRKGKY